MPPRGLYKLFTIKVHTVKTLVVALAGVGFTGFPIVVTNITAANSAF